MADYLDAIIRVVLAMYIGVLPFKALLIVERNGFILLLGLLVAWCILNRCFFYTQTSFNMLLLAFVVWVGLTVPFAVAPFYSLKEYGKLLQHMVVFYSVIYFFRDLRFRQVLLGLIGVIVIVATAYGLAQFDLENPQAVGSFLLAEVWLTTFLVMFIPFALAMALGEGPPEIRSVGTIAAGMMVVCLASTQSRAGLVALIGELWVVAWLIRSVSTKIVVSLVTLCVIAAVILVFNEATIGVSADLTHGIHIKKGVTSAVHRFEIWRFCLAEITKHWLVGIGYGNHSYLMLYGQEQESLLPGHSPITYAGTHNIILYLALHIGLPGLLLFGWFVVQFGLKTADAYRRVHAWLPKAVLLGAVGSIVGLILRLQFDQMLIGSLAIFFWVLLALAFLSYPSYSEVAREI